MQQRMGLSYVNKGDHTMICKRCNEETPTVKMSIFTPEMICNPCHLKETSHPDFEKARQADQDAISKGDFNFPGIGLPNDLELERKRN